MTLSKHERQPYRFLKVDDPEFQKLKELYESDKRSLELKKLEIVQTKESVKKYYSKIELLDKLMAVEQRAAKIVTEKLKFKISELVTTALAAVFPEPYQFEIDFVAKHNKTVCEMRFKKTKKEFGDVLYAAGGGPIDVTSFALRCAFWSLDKNRPILILDEPFKFVNDDPDKNTRSLQKKCVEMLEMVAKELKLQTIIVTTLPEFLSIGESVFNVSLNQFDQSWVRRMK